MTDGGISVFECFGGPIGGQKASIFGDARFGWYVGNGRVVSNAGSVEYKDISNASGVYVRVVRTNARRQQEEILFWKPVPGATPKEQ